MQSLESPEKIAEHREPASLDPCKKKSRTSCPVYPPLNGTYFELCIHLALNAQQVTMPFKIFSAFSKIPIPHDLNLFQPAGPYSNLFRLFLQGYQKQIIANQERNSQHAHFKISQIEMICAESHQKQHQDYLYNSRDFFHNVMIPGPWKIPAVQLGIKNSSPAANCICWD
jgi:hypothetical protein